MFSNILYDLMMSNDHRYESYVFLLAYDSTCISYIRIIYIYKYTYIYMSILLDNSMMCVLPVCGVFCVMKVCGEQ